MLAPRCVPIRLQRNLWIIRYRRRKAPNTCATAIRSICSAYAGVHTPLKLPVTLLGCMPGWAAFADTDALETCMPARRDVCHTCCLQNTLLRKTTWFFLCVCTHRNSIGSLDRAPADYPWQGSSSFCGTLTATQTHETCCQAYKRERAAPRIALPHAARSHMSYRDAAPNAAG